MELKDIFLVEDPMKVGMSEEEQHTVLVNMIEDEDANKDICTLTTCGVEQLQDTGMDGVIYVA